MANAYVVMTTVGKHTNVYLFASGEAAGSFLNEFHWGPDRSIDDDGNTEYSRVTKNGELEILYAPYSSKNNGIEVIPLLDEGEEVYAQQMFERP